MNKEILTDAINNGIDAESVNATIDDIMNKSEQKGKTPTQVKDTIETIAYMKKNVNNIPDKKYASSFVKENSEKIKAALNEGISPEEIAATLMETVEKANSRRTKKRLKFITKLIIKMKSKELTLKQQKENSNEFEMQKGRQYVLK